MNRDPDHVNPPCEAEPDAPTARGFALLMLWWGVILAFVTLVLSTGEAMLRWAW